METKKTKFEQGLEKAWKDYLAEERKKKYPNIMLIGVTGAGKSDLINRVLDAEVAKISDNARATLGYCNFYDGHLYGRKVNFIDTEGYELGQSEEYLQNISNGVNANYDGSPVHVIWYCISVANERIEPIDFRILKALKNLDTIHGRICIVFTKCDKFSAQELKKQLAYLSDFFDFAEDSMVFAVSSKDKKGVSDLKTAISDIIINIS